jgi:serine/threonine-protein kinase
MGEVYRAGDPHLNRDIALKILHDLFAVEPNRVARFKREAQILASLNHPNIAAIYGFAEANGIQALALELVDGPTLADRIAQGAIPIDEALPIARQIAGALEAAHEQGIIHRDLKPANIKLRPDGAVKVLAFGLAKALDPQTAAGTGVSALALSSPTITQSGDDDGRDDSRYRRVHGSGAGEREGRRQTCRHLGVRLCPLRDARGPSGI